MSPWVGYLTVLYIMVSIRLTMAKAYSLSGVRIDTIQVQ